VARKSGLNEPSRLQRILSVLGGADSQILARARMDTAEMTGRGIALLIPAVFGGLAALISFRYAYELSGICPSSALSALAEASPCKTAVAHRKLGQPS
jgi:hypothetical protein